MQKEDGEEWAFVARFERESAEKVADRIRQESVYDPDFWLLTLECRSDEHGLNIISG